VQALVQESRRFNCERNYQLQQLSNDLNAACASISLAPKKKYIDQLVRKLAVISFDVSEVATELRILERLYFDSLKARHSRIPNAHKETFEWIFKSGTSQFNFMQWLQAKKCIYWVSGKAGSGKSTLMKYLCDHPRTKEGLLKWANGSKLVIASCFFWNAGSCIQKSQEGLLRSLLYEVLRECPDLISIVCPSRWHSAELHAENREPWQISELSDTIRELTRQDYMPAKFCFFIDGLDEYDGDHHEIVKLLDLFTSSPNIKICLSSRPWNVFEDAYGLHSPWKLHLQDLTRGDIKIYVESELRAHNCFASLPNEDSRHGHLIQEIVDRSQGVFLWVFLVVRSLKQGFTDGDDITALERRVQALPSDLEQYFTHMLAQVDGIYLDAMCQTFQVALHTTEPLALMTYSFLDERNPNFALQLDAKPFDYDEIFLRHSQMRRRINARTKGLLEVYLEPSDIYFWARKVTWLHRTVRDFFFTKDMHSMLTKHQSKAFNVNVWLCRAYLALLKTMPRHKNHLQRNFQKMLDQITHYATQAELEGVSYAEVLHHIGNIVEAVSNQVDRKFIPQGSFLEYATVNGLKAYVAQRLDEDPSLCHINGKPLLSFALSSGEKSMGVVQMLLDRGANPNNDYRGSSIFGTWLLRSCSNGPLYSQHFLQMLQLLLSYGAGANQHYEQTTIWVAFLDWVRDIAGGDTVLTAQQTLYCFETLDALLCSGADPEVCAKKLIMRDALGRRTLFHNLLPHKYAMRLQKRLEHKRRRRECGCNLFAWFWGAEPTEDVRQPLLQGSIS
jgi:hypothetical protein